MDILAFNTSRSFGAGRAGPCQRFIKPVGFNTQQVWNSLILGWFLETQIWNTLWNSVFDSFQSNKMTLDDFEVPNSRETNISIYFPYRCQARPYSPDVHIPTNEQNMEHLRISWDVHDVHVQYLVWGRLVWSAATFWPKKKKHTNTILFWMRQGHDDLIPYIFWYISGCHCKTVGLSEKNITGNKGVCQLGIFRWVYLKLVTPFLWNIIIFFIQWPFDEFIPPDDSLWPCLCFLLSGL